MNADGNDVRHVKRIARKAGTMSDGVEKIVPDVGIGRLGPKVPSPTVTVV
jgi:hypothetical protein